MYKGNTVFVVIPAYNEERHIEQVISGMPEFVDRIVVVDDASKDATRDIVQRITHTTSKLELIVHENNQGVGGAVASGYYYAIESDADLVVVMDGDGQMDPADMEKLLDPVADDIADYAKGNRLLHGDAYNMIPKIRYFGNALLSMMTKIASGYWSTADSQSGYTAIGKKALQRIDWSTMYKRYGRPNDVLVKLNIENFRVIDIPVRPVYNIGERSDMNIFTVIFTISWLLFRLFFRRMMQKYVIRDTNPLVLFYLLGAFFLVVTVLLSARMFYFWLCLGLAIPKVNALAAMFAFMSFAIFTLFAMWFDMQDNKDLNPKL